jgi:methenyltetrahydromethanopterin cyclohydrolase
MTISVNARAWRLFEAMRDDADALGLAVQTGPRNEILVDASRGGTAAGVRMAEICLAGLGSVSLAMENALPSWPASVTVASSQPVIACLGSQYAGWSLSQPEAPKYFALGSGPARALARREPLFQELGYADKADCAVLVLEASKPPPPMLLEKITSDCGIAPDRLAVIYAPTQSVAGGVQVVARVVEVAMHKTHALHFPLDRVRDGIGTAPLPPPHPDFVQAMGRTNDAIIFGGRVHLFVSGRAEEAQKLAVALPASTSRDYGRPFAEIFAAANGDFYAIDAMLFSPAVAIVTAVESGQTFRAGRLDPALLDASFGS